MTKLRNENEMLRKKAISLSEKNVTLALKIQQLEDRIAIGDVGGPERENYLQILKKSHERQAKLFAHAYFAKKALKRIEAASSSSSQQQQQRQQDDVNDNHGNFSKDEKKYILKKLNQAVSFEAFLHTKYVGQKRFSLEGNESLIPAVDAIIEKAADQGVKEFVEELH